MTEHHVQLVEYLFTRLHQVGIRAVHGVPGDYNLIALDYLDNAGLRWVGDANELNAGTLSNCPTTLHIRDPIIAARHSPKVQGRY